MGYSMCGGVLISPRYVLSAAIAFAKKEQMGMKSTASRACRFRNNVQFSNGIAEDKKTIKSARTYEIESVRQPRKRINCTRLGH